MPHISYLPQHLVILKHALRPIAALWLLHLCSSARSTAADDPGKPTLAIPAWAVWALAYATFIGYMFELIAYFNRLQDKYGVFDHVNRPRDLAPDKHVNRLSVAVVIFTFVRTIVPVAIGYDSDNVRGSLALSLWSPVKLFAWTLVLDLAFYSVCCEHDDLIDAHSTIAPAIRSMRSGTSTRCTTARSVRDCAREQLTSRQIRRSCSASSLATCRSAPRDASAHV